MNAEDQFQACPYYEPKSVGLLSDGTTRPVEPGTCGSCGGSPRHGPSCFCPVFGEREEDD